MGSFAEGGGVPGVQAGGGEEAFPGLVCGGEPCSDEPSWLCCWACFSALRHFARLFWNQTCKDTGATDKGHFNIESHVRPTLQVYTNATGQLS